MRPLSISERQLAPTTVSLGALLDGGRPDMAGSSDLGLADYAEEIVGSGFPGIRGRRRRDREDLLDGYLDNLVEHDFAELGHVVRRPTTLRTWLRAFASATSTTTSYSSLLDAATPGVAEKPAKTTTIAYRDTLERLWMLDELPGWVGPHAHLASLTQAPKHHLADPALAARLLRVGAGALVDTPWPARTAPRDGTLLGALFESLVTTSVRAYADVLGAHVAHLRTRRGEHEVDLVVQRDDGRIVALEVKLSRFASDADVTHLRWLKERLGDDLLDAVVVTTGDVAYRRADGIAVVPAALLGP
jgi:predicted AAA+ superfamily ATPase